MRCSGRMSTPVVFLRNLPSRPRSPAQFPPFDRPLDPLAARPIIEGPGTSIGPYKLLQEIGEGGMGVVYMAEQEKPVRRRVALKIIKPGMDSSR